MVYRGLFLAVTVMLMVLYVLSRITSVMPGTNEITIPTLSLPDSTDLGVIVDRAFATSRGAVFDVLGAFTLIAAAYYTARALRRGSVVVLDPAHPRRERLISPRDLLLGLLLSLVVLVSWLLVLLTAVRTAAIVEIVGAGVPRWAVHVGKGVAVLGSAAILTALVFLPLRGLDRRSPRGEVVLASVLFALFIVAANFVLLYAYIAALVDPNTSGGVVLVLTLLAWVNVVARGIFYVECWLAEGWRTHPPSAADGRPNQ